MIHDEVVLGSSGEEDSSDTRRKSSLKDPHENEGWMKGSMSSGDVHQDRQITVGSTLARGVLMGIGNDNWRSLGPRSRNRTSASTNNWVVRMTTNFIIIQLS